MGSCCQYEACLKDRPFKGDIKVMVKLPDLMTAIEISSPGGPEVLVAAQRPLPVPGAGELLLRVAYAGVNRPDVIQRKGLYPAPPSASDLPGLEVSGTVVAVGADVDPAIIGNVYCALVSGGGYAEYCIARADVCLPVPARMEMAEAAALPETLFTVWHNVFERGWAKDGETVLVHAGTSGIGTMAIYGAMRYTNAVFAEDEASLPEGWEPPSPIGDLLLVGEPAAGGVALSGA